ncbi:MAG: penicillin-binding protein 2 [Anaerolineales bacterium]|nr:penicillin-binding protein 2 [Anaerolineales bacterium]
MRKLVLLLLLALLASACGGSSEPSSILPIGVDPTATLTVAPAASPTPEGPSPGTTAALFLDGWMKGDYPSMYALLSPASQSVVDGESFAARYRNALDTATVLTVTTQLQAVLREGDRASAAFHLTLDTALVGTLVTDTLMALSRSGEQWLVDWDPGLIWPQLAGGRYFSMEYSTPTRANIYDRNGLALATDGRIVTIGVIPGDIQDENAVLGALSSITGMQAEEIRGRYVAAPADWKVPIADVPAEISIENNALLSSLAGVYRDEKDGRLYPNGGSAPHAVGWVSPVPAEQLAAYRARGYRGDERVGVAGLEAWAETILAGQHGGKLYVVTEAGERVATVAQREAVPSRPIYTTLDRGLQEQVQRILGGRKGAIVVLDVNTGAVLALASGPGFDSNIFVGPAGAVDRSQVLADPNRPLFNRVLHGTYPSASVFKIVTMAAALEAGGMEVDTPFNCPGYWEGLGPGARKVCWKADGHGTITLKDALTASCDVTFYAVGQALDQLGSDILPHYARGFGFGQATGLQELLEDVGLVPDPEWKADVIGENWWVGDTVNLAIGQGYLLVTPLQVARMLAAVGNGGTLYAPYIVERIPPLPNGEGEQITHPRSMGQLPISAAHLAAIQEALLGVTTASIGTVPHRFAGLTIPVAGKTGTAETGGPESIPHSWFAAYAPANAPEIAIAVIVENIGEGATVAAPLTRQVVEAYYGLPLSSLPPQAEEGYAPVTLTPLPEASTEGQ